MLSKQLLRQKESKRIKDSISQECCNDERQKKTRDNDIKKELTRERESEKAAEREKEREMITCMELLRTRSSAKPFHRNLDCLTEYK